MDDFTVASFLHRLVGVLLMGGLVTFVVFLGERALGFNLRAMVDEIEKSARHGNPWPVTALLCVSIYVIGQLLR